MVSPVLFSSNSTEWATPQAFYERLNEEFHFTLDVCASEENHKCQTYFDIDTNGLLQKWDQPWWCNPPYGRGIGKWTQKASIALAPGVMLLPARTDTKWFHWDVLPHASELRFIEGRLSFVGAEAPAPFPSLLAIFSKKHLPTISVMRAYEHHNQV